MIISKVVYSMAIVGIASVSGCASVEPQRSFPEVARMVSERTAYRVHWNSGGDADKAVAAEVDELLTRPLDADSAVQIALLNNRKLQATYEDLGVAQADLVSAGLLKNPIFEGSLRFAETGGTAVIDLGIAFEFLDVFFIGARTRLAEAQLQATKAYVTSAVLGMAGEVKISFFNLQAAEQMVELRRQVEQATSASYDLARRLRAAGNNTELDLAQEQALHEESRLALAAAETNAVVAREELMRLMGLWGKRNKWTVAGRLPELPAQDGTPTDLERRAVENSLELQASRAELAVTVQQLGITLPLGYLSELEVGATAERDDGVWEFGPSVALPIPIFSQGQPAVARAQAVLRQAQHRYYAAAVDIRSNIRAAYIRAQSLRRQAEYYRTVILPLRQSIVDQTQLQYNAMQIGAFQLLQAKRDQVEAGRTYVSLLRDFWVAQTQLQLGLHGRMMPTTAAPPTGQETAPAASGGAGGH